MIPRTRVNYTLCELFSAIFCRGDSYIERNKLAKSLRDYFNYQHVTLTGSGRASLYYLLKALHQKRVIVPSYTCKAVIEACILSGKEVEYVEVDMSTFNIDFEELSLLNLNSDCIVIATHQFGIPCDIENIKNLCDANNVFLIEDVAAAFGTKVDGVLAGSWGHAAFFSFDSTKLINVPLKAGFIGTNDSRLNQLLLEKISIETKPMQLSRKFLLISKALVLIFIKNKWLYHVFHKLIFQSKRRFVLDSPEASLFLTPFYTDQISEWQAKLINRQVNKLEEIISSRKKLYARFSEEIKPGSKIILPPKDVNNDWVCIRFPILVKGDKLLFYNKAVKQGVDFAFSFTFIICPEKMINAKKIANSILDIPFYYELSEKEIKKTIQVINRLAYED